MQSSNSLFFALSQNKSGPVSSSSITTQPPCTAIESIGHPCPASSLSTSSRLKKLTTPKFLMPPSLPETRAIGPQVKKDKDTTAPLPPAEKLSDNAITGSSVGALPLSSSTEQDSKMCPQLVTLVVTKCLQIRKRQQQERRRVLMKKNAREKSVKRRKTNESQESARISQMGVAMTFADFVTSSRLWACLSKCLALVGSISAFMKQSVRSIFGYPLDSLRKSCDKGLCQTSSNCPLTTLSPDTSEGDVEVEHCGQGSFHDVWRVTLPSNSSTEAGMLGFPNHLPAECIIRIRKEDSITDATPMYVRHEVGIRQFVTRYLENVPTPRIYCWDEGEEFGVPYTIEEYVQGLPLCNVWNDFDDEQKDEVLKNLGHVLFELAKPDFTHIGGMDPMTHGIGRHLEPCMTHNDRVEVYEPDKWNVGPYSSTKEYVLAMYAKEIAFWESGNETANWSDEEADDWGQPSKFANYLRKKKDELEQSSEHFPRYERFNISHGDLAGRNILVMGTDIVSIIDWEFASILPASQFFRQTAIDEPPLQLYPSPTPMSGDESEEEIEAWQSICNDYYRKNHAAMKILKDFMIAEAAEWGWEPLEIGYLLRDWGAAEVGKVQNFMHPACEPEYRKYMLDNAATGCNKSDGPPEAEFTESSPAAGSGWKKRRRSRKKANAKRSKHLTHGSSSSSAWSKPITRKKMAKGGTFAVLDNEQNL